MRKFIPVFIICVFLIISIPRLLSLDAHWNSDEARWLQRNTDFLSAVEQGEFSDTLIAYHPGVMTMWIAGLRTFFVDAGIDVNNLIHARWFFGVAVLIGIGICALPPLLPTGILKSEVRVYTTHPKTGLIKVPVFAVVSK